MLSKWYEYKETAIELRKGGQSITAIHRNLGVPLSTLSGWLKHVPIAERHRLTLRRNQQLALENSRQKATQWHRAQKALRHLRAKQEAHVTLDKIDVSAATLDLALAMLYYREGSKTDNSTTIASSDPMILRFVLTILKKNYGVLPESISCDLHLRMDQDPTKVKRYWSHELGVPIERFKSLAIDKRSAGKPTYPRYNGVCVLNCGHVAIQRKLMYLYKSFCEKVISTMGD